MTSCQEQDAPVNAYDPLNSSTFVIPNPALNPSIIIEFCDRVTVGGELQLQVVILGLELNPAQKRLHRASWISTELLLTFPPPVVKSITIIPLNTEETAGRFRVWLFAAGEASVLIWDRKVEGSFPELKVLKQRIRDVIQPGKSLGHSDKKDESNPAAQ